MRSSILSCVLSAVIFIGCVNDQVDDQVDESVSASALTGAPSIASWAPNLGAPGVTPPQLVSWGAEQVWTGASAGAVIGVELAVPTGCHVLTATFEVSLQGSYAGITMKTRHLSQPLAGYIDSRSVSGAWGPTRSETLSVNYTPSGADKVALYVTFGGPEQMLHGASYTYDCGAAAIPTAHTIFADATQLTTAPNLSANQASLIYWSAPPISGMAWLFDHPETVVSKTFAVPYGCTISNLTVAYNQIYSTNRLRVQVIGGSTWVDTLSPTRSYWEESAWVIPVNRTVNQADVYPVVVVTGTDHLLRSLQVAFTCP
jgi:hypothetical protein